MFPGQVDKLVGVFWGEKVFFDRRNSSNYLGVSSKYTKKGGRKFLD